MSKQKILLVTFFYNPVLIDPTVLLNTQPIPEPALFAQIDACLEQGGMVQVRQDVALLPVAPDETAETPQPAHDWVGLTFIPVPALAVTKPLPEVTEDVPFL